MAVIKSINAPSSLVPFSLRDIEKQAQSMLMRAQQQAEQMLAETQETAAQMKSSALAEGKSEGRKQGLREGQEEGKKAGQQQALEESRAQLSELIKALTAVGAELNASRKQLESVAKTEVVKLAVSIARCVTKRYGVLDPAILTANISEAMKLVIHGTDVRIAIHPSQRETLNGALPSLKMQWPALEHVNLIDDAAIHPGGCRIWAGQGKVDASLDSQIDRIAGELLPAGGGASA